ncbi:MAG: hypothetical protein MJZ88_04005, partial [Paludibacteraceae bacterium]|nr:hypothetical protein [Paludibacteraceae bacterium]
RDPQLGRLVLYRLSYFRKIFAYGQKFCESLRCAELQKQAFARLAEDFRNKFVWVRMDSNHRS